MSLSNWRTDEEEVERLRGLYVGQLSPEELEVFNRMCRAGFAHRDYGHGFAGLLGLAKVRINDRQKYMP